jgi:hypothetical protein
MKITCKNDKEKENAVLKEFGILLSKNWEMNLTFKNGDFELETANLMTRREFSEGRETLAEIDKLVEDPHLGNVAEREKTGLTN